MKDILIFASKKITILTGSKCCQKCGSSQIVKNGSNSSGNPKYKCKSCGFSGVFQTVRKSQTFNDFWGAYAAVIDNGNHQMVGKKVVKLPM